MITSAAAGAEQRLAQGGLGRRHFVRQLLHRVALNQSKDQRYLVDRRRCDPDVGFHAHGSLFLPPMSRSARRDAAGPFIALLVAPTFTASLPRA
jgi:hypothetical protein